MKNRYMIFFQKICSNYFPNIYWALDREERVDHIKKSAAFHLKYLLWNISAYCKYENISEDEKTRLGVLMIDVECSIKRALGLNNEIKKKTIRFKALTFVGVFSYARKQGGDAVLKA